MSAVPYTPLQATPSEDTGFGGHAQRHARLQELRERKEQQEKDLETLKHTREKVVTLWHTRIDRLRAEIQKEKKDRHNNKREVEAIKDEAKKQDMIRKRGGPEWLHFLATEAYMVCSSAIIFANMMVMGAEVLHPHLRDEYFWLDQSFLVFYILELMCNLLLFKKDFLCNAHASKIELAWNWLDFVIVVCGVIDQWVLALLTDRSGRGAPPFMALRLLRLARILKILKNILHSDLSWADGGHFQGFIMGVIAFNSIIIAMETDFPQFPGWYFLEQVLLVIFCFELAARLKHHSKTFFTNQDAVWNWMDFIIVVGGILDQWVVPCIYIIRTLLGKPSESKGNLGKILMILRMARLLRVLRLVRLIKEEHELLDLVYGIANAMAGMGWVLVLAVVLLYSVALVIIRVISHGLAFNNGKAPKDIQDTFSSVPETMFILFEAMNGDFNDLAVLFEELPVAKIFAMVFMVLSSWAILSIMIGVISDNMINSATSKRNEQAKEKQETDLRRKKKKLNELFSPDGNKEQQDVELDLKTFKKCCQADTEKLKTCTELKDKDLECLFHNNSEHKYVVVPTLPIIEWHEDWKSRLEQTILDSQGDQPSPVDLFVITNKQKHTIPPLARIRAGSRVIDFSTMHCERSKFPLQIATKVPYIKKEDLIQSLQKEGHTVTEQTVFRLEKRLLQVDRCVTQLKQGYRSIEERIEEAERHQMRVKSEIMRHQKTLESLPADDSPDAVTNNKWQLSVHVEGSETMDNAPKSCTIEGVRTLGELCNQLVKELQLTEQVVKLSHWDPMFQMWCKPADLFEVPCHALLRLEVKAKPPPRPSSPSRSSRVHLPGMPVRRLRFGGRPAVAKAEVVAVRPTSQESTDLLALHVGPSQPTAALPSVA